MCFNLPVFLYASFGLHDHQNWCSHKVCTCDQNEMPYHILSPFQSMLCTWNVDRSRLNSKKADVTIEVPVSIIALATKQHAAC